MKRTHTNWSDNSKHSLWLIRRKKLQIVDSLGELFLFVAYWTMIPIFCWSDPDFSFQLSGRSANVDTTLRWMQCRVLFNILTTNKIEAKYKYNFDQKENCTLCDRYSESMEHLFWNCGLLKKLLE